MNKISKSNKNIVEKKKIDNSSKIDAMEHSIDFAASGVAEKLARQNNLKVIHCSAFEFGVRCLAYELIRNNIISCEDMFEFLKNNTYRGYDKCISEWWKDNE